MQLVAAIQASYTEQLALEEYYDTILSLAGWAGCAPPLVCMDCPDVDVAPHCVGMQELVLGFDQSNSDSSRCLDGTCNYQAGRYHDFSNCADGTDEQGCVADEHYFVPAFLSQSSTCPDDVRSDVPFSCTIDTCIERVGLCYSSNNCADASDEAHFCGAVQVKAAATSGRTITVETLQTPSGVFHDHDYNFVSLGHFQGETFIKYSNEDKMTDGLHILTKLSWTRSRSCSMSTFQQVCISNGE